MMKISGIKPLGCLCWQRVLRGLITGGTYDYMKGRWKKEIIVGVAKIQIRIEVFSIVKRNCVVKNNTTDQ